MIETRYRNMMFDVDGNLLNTKTTILFIDNTTKKLVEVLAHEVDQNPELYYQSSAYSFPENDPNFAFQNFHDFYPHAAHPGPDGLMYDVKYAMDNEEYASSFPDFIYKGVLNAEVVSLNTARAHTPDNLKRCFRMLLDHKITAQEREIWEQNIEKRWEGLIKKYKIPRSRYIDFYLNYVVHYMPVNNQEFCKAANINFYAKSHDKKVLAAEYMKRRADFLINENIEALNEDNDEVGETEEIVYAHGFSDDTKHNIVAMISHYIAKALEPENQSTYHVYYTVPQKEKRAEVRPNNIPENVQIEIQDKDDYVGIHIKTKE